MNKVPFWRSKRFWGLLFTAAFSFWDALRMVWPSLPPIPDQAQSWLQLFGIGLATYGSAVARGPWGVSDAASASRPR